MDAPLATPSLTTTASQGLTPPADSPPDKALGKSSGSSVVGAMISGIGSGAREAARKVDAYEAEKGKLTPPKLVLPPKPEPKSTDPVDAWGSMAMVFAALASFGARNHASTAMNAAAAALNGIKTRDKEAYDQAFNEWKVSTDNAFKMASFQQDAYRVLLESVNHKEDIAFKEGQAFDTAREAQLKALTMALGDPVMWQAYEHGGVAGAADLQKQREKQTQDFEKYKIEMSGKAAAMQRTMLAQQIVSSDAYKNAKTPRERLELLTPADPERIAGELAKLDQKDKEEADKVQKEQDSAAGQAKAQYDEWKASPEAKAATPEQRAAKEAAIYQMFKTSGGRTYPPISDENKPFLAQQLASYQIKAPSDAVLSRNPSWVGVLEEAHKINPDFNEAKYDLVKKMRDSMTNGKDAAAIASYVRLNQHLELFDQLVGKLSNGTPVKVLDGIAAAFGRQTGDSNVTSYETAMDLIGDEIVKAATGTGAAGALADREAIKANFSPSLTKEQLRANIDAVRTLVGGAIFSTLNKYSGTFSPQELELATGLSKETLEKYHVDLPKSRMNVQGPIRFGGKTVEVGAQGVGEASQQPAQPAQSAPAPTGNEPRATNDQGVTIIFRNGQWVTEDGKPYVAQ